MRQGIISNDGSTENCIKLRIDAKDKSTSNTRDNTIANAYRDNFIILLDFEMLDSAIPYYQWGLGNSLFYHLMFNNYNRVIKSTGANPDAKYEISDISLKYEIVTHPDLARHIELEYKNMVLLYDRVLRHR